VFVFFSLVLDNKQSLNYKLARPTRGTAMPARAAPAVEWHGLLPTFLPSYLPTFLPRHPLLQHERAQEHQPVEQHHAHEDKEAYPLVDVHDLWQTSNATNRSASECRVSGVGCRVSACSILEQVCTRRIVNSTHRSSSAPRRRSRCRCRSESPIRRCFQTRCA